MRRGEAFQAVNETIRKIDIAVAHARFFGTTGEDLHQAARSVVRGMTGGRAAPTWARAYVVGYYLALRGGLFTRDLYFGHVRPDGVILTADKRLGDTIGQYYGGRLGEDWKQWPVGHFWLPGWEGLRDHHPFHTDCDPVVENWTEGMVFED